MSRSRLFCFILFACRRVKVAVIAVTLWSSGVLVCLFGVCFVLGVVDVHCSRLGLARPRGVFARAACFLTSTIMTSMTYSRCRCMTYDHDFVRFVRLVRVVALLSCLVLCFTLSVLSYNGRSIYSYRCKETIVLHCHSCMVAERGFTIDGLSLVKPRTSC